MTDWLFKEDNYIPVKDKSSYLDKSILSILGTLSKIRQDGLSGKKGYYKISPPVKLFFTLTMIIFLAVSRNLFFILAVDSLVLLITSLLALKDIKKIVPIVAIVIVFSMVILSPSVLMGNLFNSLLIILKIIGCVTLVNVLSYTSKMDDITRSLRIFLLPNIIILVIDLTLKYIMILGDFSINMLLSLKLRSFGKNRKKHHSLSNLIGVLFLKSKEMAEDAYDAMQCRGFDSEYRYGLKFKITSADLIYIFANVSIIGLFFLI